MAPAGRRGGLASRCPECAAEYRRACNREWARERRALDSSKYEAMKEWRNARHANNPEHARKRLDAKLRKMYGITADDYFSMIEEQAGLCAICGMPPEGRGKGGTLVVDHCHKRGVVRSLLCGKCNIGIGLLDDNPSLIDKAAAYVRRWDAAESG